MLSGRIGAVFSQPLTLTFGDRSEELSPLPEFGLVVDLDQLAVDGPLPPLLAEQSGQLRREFDITLERPRWELMHVNTFLEE